MILMRIFRHPRIMPQLPINSHKDGGKLYVKPDNAHAGIHSLVPSANLMHSFSFVKSG